MYLIVTVHFSYGMKLLAYSYPRFVETFSKFYKQARRERLTESTDTVFNTRVPTEMSYRPGNT